jgi:hypothetical protein
MLQPVCKEYVQSNPVQRELGMQAKSRRSVSSFAAQLRISSSSIIRLTAIKIQNFFPLTTFCNVHIEMTLTDAH